MSKIAIQVDNVSKLYQLGTIGSGSLRKEVYRWWTVSVKKKDDPLRQESDSWMNEDSPSHIWALNQVSFDVKQGEVWGIVGGNGSGKSTLLKIISRIIRPTNGTVRGNGRLSSMLEVGAGFHHELSGRENIYLSGYVLGMSRYEIRQRFDEIIEFSGIGPFIDTPVKRYSSGMYVRLAFAVAAHLHTDILILDEVLAVGDTEFQKKCLAKIQDFARNEGRTILFVSHNLQAVGHLCQQALWLKRGSVAAIGPVQATLNQYAALTQANQLSQHWDEPALAPGNHWIRLQSVALIPDLESPDGSIDTRTPLTVQFRCWVLRDDIRLLPTFRVNSYEGECVFDIISSFSSFNKGIIEGTCLIPGHFLNDGAYTLSLVIYQNSWEDYFEKADCLSFDVADYRESSKNFGGKWWGAVRPNFPLHLRQVATEQSVSSLPGKLVL